MTNFRFYLLVSLAVLFALFVWPTSWRYEHSDQVLVRINTVTGSIERLDIGDGWVQITKRPEYSAAPAAEAPPAAPAATVPVETDEEFIRRRFGKLRNAQ